MKLEIITKDAFRVGDEIEVNGIPYEIMNVDREHGLTIACKVPGLESEPGVPLTLSELVRWTDILQTRMI
ncbi:hypothetical protein SEA_GALACTICA_88 [Streptomyces phage Galactica]|nr:hypothetical protein SEA_GALACTICA_88 [Streptomyces phage Galactica]